MSLPGGKYAWVDTIVLGYIIWKCTWQEGKHHCWRCRDRQRWFAWPTCKGPAKILMQLAFIPQGDWEVYETMDSCTCPQPTQPTRSRKNKKAQGGLINRKSHGGWSMKDSNILTTFLAHGWATSGTQTFCAFTKLANINTLLTRFFSQLLVFGLGKAQFTPKSSNISRHRMMGIFFHMFFLSISTRPLVLQSGPQGAGAPEICHVGEKTIGWNNASLEKFTARLYLPLVEFLVSFICKVYLGFIYYLLFTYLYLGQTKILDH